MKPQLCDRWMTSLVALMSLVAAAPATIRAEPRILVTPFLQAPVAALPGEFLMLSGSDIRNDDKWVALGTKVGGGVKLPLQAVSSSGDSAIVLIPSQLSATMPLALRLVRSGLPVGRELRLNEPRPLWFHLDARSILTIVGHNLDASRLDPRPIVLVGARNHVLGKVTRVGTNDRGYWFQVLIPSSVRPGRYRVEVRDRFGGRHGVAEQGLELSRPLVTSRVYRWEDAVPQSCLATGPVDRSVCLQKALHSVADRGGGSLVLPPGRLQIGATTRGPDWFRHGIVVPSGVSLTADRQGSTLVWRPVDDGDPQQPALTLTGGNEIRGIHFVAARFKGRSRRNGPFVQLGRDLFLSLQAGSTDSTGIADVRIVQNSFESERQAIADSGRPIVRLSIADNEFASSHTAIYLGGNRYLHGTRFGIEDSAIVRNRFMPGNSGDGNSAPIATEMGAARRVLFLDNVADVARPAVATRSGRGAVWRAGFFWHLQDSVEMLLVAENRVVCVGGRSTDGEAIALDNNANTFGFEGLAEVVTAAPQLVTVDRLLRMRQQQRELRDTRYYIGHWLRVVSGVGIGQSRRITDVRHDINKGKVTLVLDKPWDIVPQSGLSSVVVARQFWQVLVVGNSVDLRPATCGEPDDSSPRGGSIALWGQASDVVIADNRMHHTDGIVYHQAYSFRDDACPDCIDNVSLLAMIGIHGNWLNNERLQEHNCGDSGIRASFGSTPSPRYPPPVLGYGIRIAGNTIRSADSVHGGAIAFPLTWHGGAVDGVGRPPILLRHVVVEQNRITDRRAATGRGRCRPAAVPRIGIHLPSRQVADVMIHRNRCDGPAVAIKDDAAVATRVCATSDANCGCSPGKKQIEQPDSEH